MSNILTVSVKYSIYHRPPIHNHVGSVVSIKIVLTKVWIIKTFNFIILMHMLKCVKLLCCLQRSVQEDMFVAYPAALCLVITAGQFARSACYGLNIVHATGSKFKFSYFFFRFPYKKQEPFPPFDNISHPYCILPLGYCSLGMWGTISTALVLFFNWDQSSLHDSPLLFFVPASHHDNLVHCVHKISTGVIYTTIYNLLQWWNLFCCQSITCQEDLQVGNLDIDPATCQHHRK
jgi:hypothetical protein